MRKRASGLLLHITSLPSRYGVGDLGPGAYRFIDFLVKAKQRYWQVLPLCPPIPGCSYSPYNCLSAFAVNTLLISPELLQKKGFLSKSDIQGIPSFPKSYLDYGSAILYKTKLLRVAYERFKSMRKNAEYERFCTQNRSWLEGFAAFFALRQHFGFCSWREWPAELRDRNEQALSSIKVNLKDAIDQEKFSQFVFFTQWYHLKQYCNQHGIYLIGDIPFYVSYDSSDVWVNPEYFKLTKAKTPRFIAGVPPDYFSRTGQLWGNPVYNWKVLKSQNYSWWIRRIKHNLKMFDMVRLDHFRGFAASWHVPANSVHAKDGRWVKGPQEEFFNILFKQLSPDAVIIEDLGYITRDVKRLIERFNLRSMRVLQFAFDDDPTTNSHYPHNHTNNCVVYTGTHDNNTIKGWFAKELGTKRKKKLYTYLGRKVASTSIHWELIRMAMSSVAELAIIPMQDVLGLGEQARMNRPATVEGNWTWRLTPGQINASVAKRLAKLTETFGRA